MNPVYIWILIVLIVFVIWVTSLTQSKNQGFEDTALFPKTVETKTDEPVPEVLEINSTELVEDDQKVDHVKEEVNRAADAYFEQQSVITDLLKQLWMYREKTAKVTSQQKSWIEFSEHLEADIAKIQTINPKKQYYYIDEEFHFYHSTMPTSTPMRVEGLVIPFDNGNDYILALTQSGIGSLITKRAELNPEQLIEILVKSSRNQFH